MDGEKLTEALARETYLAHAGHKDTAELERIYASFPDVVSGRWVPLLREWFATAGDDGERRSARALLEWQVELSVSRQLVDLDEREIAWESRATIAFGDGSTLSYQRAPIEIANSGDRARREAIDAARAAVAAAEHGTMRRERLQRERDLVEAAGIAGTYVETFEMLAGFSLRALAHQCETFLEHSEPMWAETLRYYLKRSLGVAPADATRADALRLFRAADFDDWFRASSLEPAIRRYVTEMGIDPTADGHVEYDLAERAGKRSRAFCAPVRVPSEVHLVLLPHGGQADYSTLLHELGHALHFGYTSAALPFEFQWLGDNSVTEGYAMLFDHRMQNPGWLLRYTDLDRARVGEFLRVTALEELHFVRRYCAKLLYELEVYAERGNWSRLESVYVDRLSGATSFRYREADAFVDLDSGFYSARYLRAWQLQALLDDTLRERFDEDWHRNPAAGPWLVEAMFSRGQSETADDLASSLGATLSFDPILRAVEGVLS